MLRKCRDCGVEAHTEEELDIFSKNKHNLYGRTMRCKECSCIAQREYEKQSKSQLKHQARKRYSCTVEEYEERMSSSETCEVCGVANSNKTGYKLCYDHCHDTMKFRGVLCTNCNRAIGQLGDTLEGVMKAVKYLKKGENND